MKDLLESLARWPLLLGACLMFLIAIIEETREDLNPDANVVAFGAAVVGSVLLGAWVWSLAIESERRHARDTPKKSPDSENGQGRA